VLIAIFSVIGVVAIGFAGFVLYQKKIKGKISKLGIKATKLS